MNRPKNMRKSQLAKTIIKSEGEKKKKKKRKEKKKKEKKKKTKKKKTKTVTCGMVSSGEFLTQVSRHGRHVLT